MVSSSCLSPTFYSLIRIQRFLSPLTYGFPPSRASSDPANGAEEGEVSQSSHQPPAKEARIGRGPQKKSSTGTSKELGGIQSKKPSIWRPLFTLSSGNLALDDANLRDPQKGSSGLLAECLEKALCLLEDMAELRSFRKREVFLALK